MAKEYSAGERKKIENKARLVLGVSADTKMAWVGKIMMWHSLGCLLVSRIILREDSKPNGKHIAVCPKCLVADKVLAPKPKGKK